QLTLADLITTHAYDRHVRAGRLRYRRRRDELVRRIATVPNVAVAGVAAGLHAVLRLTEGTSVEAVLASAAQQDLALDHVDRHRHTPGRDESGLIVGYGTPPDGRFAAALKVLVRVLRAAA